MGGLANTVGSMVGIGGGPAAQGMNWQPGGAPLIMPTTQAEADTAYNNAQTGISNQSKFLAALQAQNGIGNQSSVFNQLQDVAAGKGPNPAQAMLAQATGANTANQAALMAGQRGAGANVGLIARQAAQQGGTNQQQAAGQAATMQANQSLAALSQLGGIAGQQVGQQAAATSALTGAQQSEQQLLLNSIAQENAANVQQSNALNTINAQQAGAGAKAQSGLLQGIAGGIGLAKGGPVPHMADGGWTQVGPTVGGGNDMPAIDPSRQPLQFKNEPGPQNLSNPSAPIAPTAPRQFAKPVSSALGSNDPASKQSQQDAFTQSGQSMGQDVGKGLSSLAGSIKGLFGGSSGNSQDGYQADAGTMKNLDWGSAPSQDINPNAANGDWANLAHGGKVPAMVSPGERYLPPKEVEKVAKGQKSPLKAGEKIPGKAKVKGDSLKNDTVPKTLEEGGIVLPKSVMESKHPHWEAHKFVSAILAQNGRLPAKRKKD